MNEGDGSGAGVEFETMRGRDFPTIRQFTVFLENRVGQLLEVLRRFRGGKTRILALNIIDSTECCIVRLVLSHPEAGREILERAGLAMIESDLIAVVIEHDEPLIDICTSLLQAEVNLVQTYPLLVRSVSGTVVAVMVDNVDLATETLNKSGIRLLSENELLDLT